MPHPTRHSASKNSKRPGRYARRRPGWAPYVILAFSFLAQLFFFILFAHAKLRFFCPRLFFHEEAFFFHPRDIAYGAVDASNAPLRVPKLALVGEIRRGGSWRPSSRGWRRGSPRGSSGSCWARKRRPRGRRRRPGEARASEKLLVLPSKVHVRLYSRQQ